MGSSHLDGPQYVYGNMAGLPLGYGDSTPDPNQDAGPSITFQGWGIPDVRYPFLKDQITGYTGRVPAHVSQPYIMSVDAIPAALGAANVAAAALLVAGAAMTLASALTTGVTPGVQIRPVVPGTFALNGGALTTVIALDFGFAFGNVTAATAQVTVADSTQFTVGEPLVMGGVGNAGLTTSLYTNVASIVDATHITVGPNLPLGTLATSPIGTGNFWGPSPVTSPTNSFPAGFPIPDAAMAYIAGGPGLFLDPRQSLMRGLSFTGVSGGTGGNVLVTGYDVFGQLQTQLQALPVGATTTYSLKTWKYILSIVPAAGVDTTHNYSVGTSDIFGAAVRGLEFEYQDIFWGGLFNANTQANSGWLAGDTTTPSTNLRGDPRGTFQSSANGGGTGETGGSASNGTISSLAMSGRRLAWFSTLRVADLVNMFPATPQFMYGVAPV